MQVTDGTFYKWDERFLKLAKEISKWSKDPSTKVGCVLTDHNRHVISTGYNGFPPGVVDRPEWLADRDTKLLFTIHAEMNAVLQARRDLRGCNVYVSVPFICKECARNLIGAGVGRICVAGGETPTRWKDEWEKSLEIFGASTVELIEESINV